MDDEDGLLDPFQCRLELRVPRGKRRLLRKIISPLTNWIDPSFRLINIQENGEIEKCEKLSSEKNTEVEFIRIPSLSVMSFLSEKGIDCAKDVQGNFRKRPWKFHHKVELYSRRSPEHAAACQEFYGIADDMPLWSICPVHCGNEHLRFLIYVKHFQKMVEFYRAITDIEMESNKPGFCIFQLYSQPGMDIQLALKYSKHIEPYPAHNANLVFKVKNIEVVRTTLTCNITQLDNGLYSVQDPDGNTLHITEDENQQQVLSRSTCREIPECSNEDLKSYRSSSDSHDSGRCSDSENWSSEPETSKSESLKRLNYDINVISTDKLSPSVDDSRESLVYKGATHRQGQLDKLDRQNCIEMPDNYSHKRKVEPVYLWLTLN